MDVKQKILTDDSAACNNWPQTIKTLIFSAFLPPKTALLLFAIFSISFIVEKTLKSWILGLSVTKPSYNFPITI